jgi:hypothetical protein
VAFIASPRSYVRSKVRPAWRSEALELPLP